MTGRFSPRNALLSLAAPTVAVLIAVGLSSIALVVSNINPTYTFLRMFEYGSEPDSVVDILNKSTFFYLSAVAVAIGFRMNLFNIGVDGQYQLAAMAAAVVGGAAVMRNAPGPLLLVLLMVVAVIVGAAWSGVAAMLKVTRGVSEVISTIMLNAVAAGLLAYFVSTKWFGVLEPGANIIHTNELPSGAWMPGISFPGTGHKVYGFLVIAVAVGIGYWLLVKRTRFGFDLRAAGANPSAAVASGVSVRKMIVLSMLISGGVAGLVGLPLLLGETHQFTTDFPTGIGFTGIAIALLGRNHPVGIALAAVFWSFLDRSAQILDLDGIPREIVVIMQGVSVLAVVVAYEVVNRARRRAEQRRVGRQLGSDIPDEPDEPAALAGAPKGAPA